MLSTIEKLLDSSITLQSTFLFNTLHVWPQCLFIITHTLRTVASIVLTQWVTMVNTTKDHNQAPLKTGHSCVVPTYYDKGMMRLQALHAQINQSVCTMEKQIGGASKGILSRTRPPESR